MDKKELRKELELTLIKLIQDALNKRNALIAKEIQKTTNESAKNIAKKFYKILKTKAKVVKAKKGNVKISLKKPMVVVMNSLAASGGYMASLASDHIIAHNGTLTGSILELWREVCSATSAPVIASGGISELQDLIDLRAMTNLGVEGAIVGKAIYSGAFSLAQALEVAVK